MIRLQKNLFEGEGVLTQGFGENPALYAKFGLKGHNGIDYGIPTGRKLYSCIEGRVIEAQLDATGYGNYVKIERGDCGVIYGHMKSFAVKVGEFVKAGQVIGLSNNTGNSTGPHLHFGVFPVPRDRNNGYAGYIDPFDKKLVEWVDNYYEEESSIESQIEVLQNEIIEIRKSRDKWKSIVEDERKEHEKEVRDLKEHIESIQKTLSEDGVVSAESQARIYELEQKLTELSKNYDLLSTRRDELLRENESLREQVKKEVSMEYPKWKIVAWRYVRVFLASFLVSFASGLVGATDFDALMALVVASLTAAIPAVAKLLREEVSGGDQTSMVNKLPL